MKTHQYNVNVHWDSDRKGMTCSPEIKKPHRKKVALKLQRHRSFQKAYLGYGLPNICLPLLSAAAL